MSCRRRVQVRPVPAYHRLRRQRPLPSSRSLSEEAMGAVVQGAGGRRAAAVAADWLSDTKLAAAVQ